MALLHNQLAAFTSCKDTVMQVAQCNLEKNEIKMEDYHVLNLVSITGCEIVFMKSHDILLLLS